MLGPSIADGSFAPVAIKSIHYKRLSVPEVVAGQTAAVALKKVRIAPPPLLPPLHSLGVRHPHPNLLASHEPYRLSPQHDGQPPQVSTKTKPTLTVDARAPCH